MTPEIEVKTDSKQENRKKKKSVSEEPSQAISPDIRDAIINSLKGALSRGPLKGYPVRGVRIVCETVQLKDGSEGNLGLVRIASISALHKLYDVSGPQLLEPVFSFEATVPDTDLGDILSDLTGRRRANIISVDPSSPGRTLIKAFVPAVELLSYSKILRTITGGNGSYSAIFSKYDIAENVD